MKTVVICGGGIIGCSIAYYLTKLEKDFAKVIIIERNEIAGHASGKAGGFLALDWNDDNGAVGPLSRKSFQLHEELSKELNDIDYRKLNTLSVSAKKCSNIRKETNKATKLRTSKYPDWLNGNESTIQNVQNIGNENTTAQVHPYKLTKALCDHAVSRGTEIVIGKVNGFEFEEKNGKTYVTGVKVDNDIIEASIVVIAMGPWSSQVKSFFPNFPSFPNIRGGKAHSIVIEADVSPDALFMSYTSDRGKEEDPEFYPRPDGTVYMCGQGRPDKLPDDPKDISPNEDAIQKLRKMASELSSTLEEGTLSNSQACYLPWSPDTKPIISSIPNYEGAFIATGHGCWGILNGPATGLAMAQLILNKPSQIDISEFSMSRFM